MSHDNDTDPDSMPVRLKGSPYATGGGGVVLEHAFGATVLASLLLGNSVPGLGDEYTTVEVTFQHRSNAVDDLFITGRVRDHAGTSERYLAVGVRHKPAIAPSDDEFVALLGNFLHDVEQHWIQIQAGSWRLGLAVAAPNTGAMDLDTLAQFARTQADSGGFYSHVEGAGTTSSKVRMRLKLLCDAVEKASQSSGLTSVGGGTQELSWRLLVALHIIPLELERDSASSRTSVVMKLREAVVGDASAADTLFSKLCECAARYAANGATVTEVILRRDLAGVVRLSRSRSYADAWQILDYLGQRLRQRTGRELVSQASKQRLHLARTELQQRLMAQMRSVASSGQALIVSGPPDVGKTSLTLAASDELAATGASITAISLGDLPISGFDMIARLGARLESVLAGQSVKAVRLLVVDGAEAVLEGRHNMLSDLASAARDAGIGLVVIARSDAREAVLEAVTPNAATSHSGSPVSFEIGGLEEKEVKEVVAAFPALGRLAAEPRSAWLLRSVGLLDLLLKADAVKALPNGALSEADVFAAVWGKLVRNGERTELGRGSPDSRDIALLNLARRRLLTVVPVEFAGDPSALPSLRSDGLLLPPGPTAAWETDDQFATDLIRDFAVARLLIREGWKVLSDAGAPRWSFRAARLASEAKLAEARTSVERARIDLQTFFDDLASDYGDRWADVPLEAMLALGDPHAGLEKAWTNLISQRGEGLQRLLRITQQRYSEGDIGDPVLTRPVVHLLVEHQDELAELPWSVYEAARTATIGWLRGLAVAGKNDISDPLRIRIRDLVLDSKPERGDEYAFEILGLLGPDLDETTAIFLNSLAEEYPDFLAPCIESFPSALSMAIHRPELLLELAEAYYIERRDHTNDFYSPGLDDGVRGHECIQPFGGHLAAWYYGPFWQLMRARPRPTLAFINRMLDHATRFRAKALRSLEAGRTRSEYGDLDERSMPAVEISVASVQSRYVGDSHAWSWYRGSSVGPYPCMSALMAVERYLDQARMVGIGLRNLVTVALRDCHNLAMPGLVVGFLVRHIDEVTDELDSWLAEPSIWRLEFGRVTSEGQIHVQGGDEADVHGRKLRKWSFREVATTLTIRALVVNDTERLAELDKVADELVRRATVGAGVAGAETVEMVNLWASTLRRGSYKLVEGENGSNEVHYTPPNVSDTYAEQMADLDRTGTIIQLLNKYTTDDRRRPPDIDDLHKDLGAGMELSANAPSMGQPFVKDALAGLAATALIAMGEGTLHIDYDAFKWAVEIVVGASAASEQGRIWENGFFAMGADRSAALAIPVLLLPAFNEDRPGWSDGEDLESVSHAIQHSLSSTSADVRRFAARGLDPIWNAPCSPGRRGTPACRHQIGLAAIDAAARNCRLGPFDIRSHRRPTHPIQGPAAQGLDDVPAEDLLSTHLATLLVATSVCAASTCCAASDALTLRDALMRAYIRAYVLRTEPGYSVHSEQDHRLVSSTLLALMRAGDDTLLHMYLDAVREAPGALERLLTDLVETVTYKQDQRPTLWNAWDRVMAFGLDALAAAYKRERRKDRHAQRDLESAIAALLPAPQFRMEDQDPEGTLKEVRASWIRPERLTPLMGRWISLAAGFPECVNSLVLLLQTTPAEFQVTQGLDWVLQTINEKYGEIASRSWQLPFWLEHLKASGLLDAMRLIKYERLVDQLASHGNSRAVRLQQSLE